MAAIISANINIFLAFIPPVLWLLFYLREDRHPEPKMLLILTFIGGMASAFVALAVEIFILGGEGSIVGVSMVATPFLFFLIIGLIEEYSKYLPVKFLMVQRSDFDEPIDGMVYMMTSALGFAAVENALFILPFFFDLVQDVVAVLPLTQENVLLSLDVTANRFLGANLLHALSSGIVGFFMARAWFHPHRHHFVSLGIILATLLHGIFNYLILVREVLPQGTFYIILLLAVMAIMVLIDFERLKNQKLIDKTKTT
jgi:RsiW-degrading membrane proteinase PrsW (M82 family)